MGSLRWTLERESEHSAHGPRQLFARLLLLLMLLLLLPLLLLL